MNSLVRFRSASMRLSGFSRQLQIARTMSDSVSDTQKWFEKGLETKKATVNQQNLIEMVAAETDLSEYQIAKIYKSIFDNISNAVAGGKRWVHAAIIIHPVSPRQWQNVFVALECVSTSLVLLSVFTEKPKCTRLTGQIHPR